MYHAPVARPASGKSTTLPLEWDTSTSSLSVTLPHLEYPTVLVYGLSTSVPEQKAAGGYGFGVPSWLRIPKIGGGEVSLEDLDEEEEQERVEAQKKQPEDTKAHGHGHGRELGKVSFKSIKPKLAKKRKRRN